MTKNYLYIAALLLCLCTVPALAQDGKQPIEVNFYPNPVSNGKIYITSKSALDKEVTIFDVLGKKVLQATLNAKELNISTLSPGVYIIKIREGEAATTRKLIVK